ncbi:transketolase [Puniceicoccales bacterium CK1056]|uniref:Transketolase n=2 Tax=Oceanipulchritudo coccoides TaxID=2706888 RepID=A0A6B2M174_9BACT|nr:transketolase [Oceanipulchritudo coccoides]
MDTEILKKSAAQARGLAIDAIHTAGIGHLGLPLGCAEIGASLFSESLSFNPDKPRWINRDRFVLSAGHGSMFLYGWLHLSGYDLSMDEIRKFRQLHSKTPGHPEFGETDGVESTTGPLGQGVGNAVGIAISQKMCAEKFNTAEHQIIDNHVVCLAGDGCFQEGVAMEASSLAGHLGLDNLIVILDSNDVTLDAMAEVTQSEDTGKRYEAMGFDVVTIDGHDFAAVAKAVAEAKAADNGKPKLIIAKTEIGRGIEEVAGTSKAHGEGGAKFAESARAKLGLPAETFYVSEDVKAYFAEKKAEKISSFTEWEKTYKAWKSANSELAALLESAEAGKRPTAEECLEMIPAFPADAKLATRAAGGKVLQPLAAGLPLMTTGSADLFGSNKNYLEGLGDLSRDNFSGRNTWYGIREHAMGAVCNGIAYDGIFITSGATFLVFSDYMRASIRLAGLANLPVFHVFTHDSVGVGEDGPTHQPVETTSALRLIPNVDVIRPGDPEETAAAFAMAVARKDGPTCLVLSRQNLPNQNDIPVEARRLGTLKGGYVARKESGELKAVILATGSELQHALVAAEQLGDGVRVVSMPSLEVFDRQDNAYKEEVIPSACKARVAIEAGVGGLWYKYTGLDGKVVSIDRFGLSAPGDLVMKELGMEPASVVAAAQSLL